MGTIKYINNGTFKFNMVKVIVNKTGPTTRKFLITIPKTIIDLKNIEKGDEVHFKLKKDKIYLEFEKSKENEKR